MGVRATAALAGVLALGIGAPLALAGTSSINCRGGKTIYRQGGARVFELHFTDSDGYPHHELLACRPGSRIPIKLYDAGPFVFVEGRKVQRFGSRLGFVVDSQGYD